MAIQSSSIGVVYDLGASLIRVPIMEHTEWANDDDDPKHFKWSRFYVKDNCKRKGIESSMQLMQEFKKRGVERFLASPWSPPQYMKTNRSPIEGGFLQAGMEAEFAEYLAAYVMLAKKNWDIDLSWISLQNESIFSEFYRSCLYHGFSMRETVRAVMRKFEKEGIQSKILINEDMLYPERVIHGVSPTMTDPETRSFNGHFAVHRKAEVDELPQWVEQTRDYERQSWMTETSGHPLTWKGAMKLASDIHHYLAVGNFSAWTYWQISGSPSVYSILIDGEPSFKYYVSKHFYRYIRPGALRVEVETGVDEILASAYRHDSDGTLTVVVINPTDESRQISLYSNDSNLPESYQWFLSTETIGCESKGAVSAEDLEIELPPQSVVTFYGSNAKLKRSEPVKSPIAWEVPEAVKSEVWGSDEALPFKQDWQSNPSGNVRFLTRVENAIKEHTLCTIRANGWGLLHDATLSGNVEAMRLLLEHGIDVNSKAVDGWTPLHVSVSSFGHGESEGYSEYDRFKILLDAGANPNAKTKDGWTVLHAAAANAYTGWRQHPEDEINTLTALVGAGADPNSCDSHGRTALHLAAWQGYPMFTNLPEYPEAEGLVVLGDVVRKLLELGANVDAIDDIGRTALHYACEMGYETIVYELLRKGADVTITDLAGETPVAIATRRNDEGVLRILQTGELPGNLHSIVKTVEHEGKRLGPELLKAAWQGDLDLVKQFLKQGADTGYVDTDGFKAIDRARDSGYLEIVRLLKSEKRQ